MSLSKIVKDSWGRELFYIKSAPAFYATGATQDIFTISGGPVHIHAIVEYLDTVMSNATLTNLFVGAVAMDNGALAIGVTAAAGYMVVSPLACGGAHAKIAPALVVQMPSLIARTANLVGVVAAPGQTINVTFGAPEMAAANRYSLIVLYRKMIPEALIS